VTEPILRVLTINVWRHGGDWPARRRVLVDGIRTLAPDIVALQECIVADGSDQAVELVGPDYEVVHQRQRRADGRGIAIAARWPVRRTDEIDPHVAPRTAGFECGAVFAELHPGLRHPRRRRLGQRPFRCHGRSRIGGFPASW
jgi:hypothetical protein